MDDEQKVEMLKRALIEPLERIRTLDEFRAIIKKYFNITAIKPYLLNKLDEWEQNTLASKTTIDEKAGEISKLKDEL